MVVPEANRHYGTDLVMSDDENTAALRLRNFTNASKYVELALGLNDTNMSEDGGFDCYGGDYEVAYMYPQQMMASDGAWSSSQSSLTSSCYTEARAECRSATIEATSLKESMQQNRHSLQNKLMTRRPVAILVGQGIIPPLQTPPTIYTKRQKLERAKTGDFLKHKIQRRPERAELVQQHILPDTHVDPCIAERQRQLKRARLVDDLNERLSHRPGPLDLVRANVLQPDKNISDAIQRGLLRLETEPSECKKMCLNNFPSDLNQVEHQNRVKMYPGSVSPENTMEIDLQQDLAFALKNAGQNITTSGILYEKDLFQTSVAKIEFKNAHNNNDSSNTVVVPLLNQVHSAPNLSLLYPVSGPRLEPTKRVGSRVTQPDTRAPTSSSPPSQYKMVILKPALPSKPGPSNKSVGGKIAPGKKNLPPPPLPTNCSSCSTDGVIDKITKFPTPGSISTSNTTVTTTASTNKLKTIKFHEYKGPPGILNCGGNASTTGSTPVPPYTQNSNCFNASNVISTTMPVLPPCSSTYEFVLQQQRLFLQLQMECQQSLGLSCPSNTKQVKPSHRPSSSHFLVPTCKGVIPSKGKRHPQDEVQDLVAPFKQSPPATIAYNPASYQQGPRPEQVSSHNVKQKNAVVAEVKGSHVVSNAQVMRAEPGKMFTTTLVEIRPKFTAPPNNQSCGTPEPDKNIEIYEFTDDNTSTITPPAVGTDLTLIQRPTIYPNGGLRDEARRHNSGFINFFEEFGIPTTSLAEPDNLDGTWTDPDDAFINTQDIPFLDAFIKTPSKSLSYPPIRPLPTDGKKVISAVNSLNLELPPQTVAKALAEPQIDPGKANNYGLVEEVAPVSSSPSASATQQSETLISSTGISAVESIKKTACNSKGKRKNGQTLANQQRSIAKANAEEASKIRGDCKDVSSHKAISNGHKISQPKLILSLESLTVPELRAELKKRKMTVSGPKPYLIERLKPYAEDILETRKNGSPLNNSTGCSPVNKTDNNNQDSPPIPDVGTCQVDKDFPSTASITKPEPMVSACREQNDNNLFTLFKRLNGSNSDSHMRHSSPSVETPMGTGQFLTPNSSSGAALSSDMMTLLLLANNLRQLRDQQNTLFMNQNNILSHTAQRAAIRTSPTYHAASNGAPKDSCPTADHNRPIPQLAAPYTIIDNNSSPSSILHGFKDSYNQQINEGRLTNGCGTEVEIPLPIAIKLQREKIAELQRQLNRSQLELEIQLAAATEKFNASPKSIQIPAAAGNLFRNQPLLNQQRIVSNVPKLNDAPITVSNNDKRWDTDEKGCQGQSYVNMLENYNEIIMQHQVLTHQLKNLKLPKGQDTASFSETYGTPQVAPQTNGKATLEPLVMASPSLNLATYPQSHITPRQQASSCRSNNTPTNPCYSPQVTQAKKVTATLTNHQQFHSHNTDLLLEDLSLAERQKLGFDSFLSEYMNRAKAQAAPPHQNPTTTYKNERPISDLNVPTNFKPPDDNQNQYFVQMPNPVPAPFNHADFLDLFPPEDDLEMLSNSPLPIDINTFNWDKLMTAD